MSNYDNFYVSIGDTFSKFLDSSLTTELLLQDLLKAESHLSRVNRDILLTELKCWFKSMFSDSGIISYDGCSVILKLSGLTKQMSWTDLSPMEAYLDRLSKTIATHIQNECYNIKSSDMVSGLSHIISLDNNDPDLSEVESLNNSLTTLIAIYFTTFNSTNSRAVYRLS